MRIALALLCLVTIGLNAFSALMASESDELREKARHLEREAAELERLGRAEEAGELHRKAPELRERAEHEADEHERASEREIDKLTRHLDELLDKQRRMREADAPRRDMEQINERIGDVERQLDRLHAEARERHHARHHERPRLESPRDLEEIVRRIEHFRIAAQHLREAGAQDLANELLEKAEVHEREVREAHERMREEAEQRHHRREEERREEGARAEVGDLRREVDGLRKQLGEIAGQLRELRQAH